MAGLFSTSQGSAGHHRKIARRLSEGGQRSRDQAEADRRGIDPLQSAPQEMAAYIAAETAKWQKVIKTAGIKLD
jgi:tripartite-type tricarboxylate transporter receptor subunit TctC